MTKVRMAPSPTGLLHIGTARTALFNWLYAKKMGGEFILRIEDTDLERSEKRFETDIIDGLKWLGINWSNKEIIRQSERLDKYEQHLKELLDSGYAFWCDHSKEELDAEQAKLSAEKKAPLHICDHKHKKLDKGQLIRLDTEKFTDKIIVFKDSIRGDIKTDIRLLGDFSLAKNLRTPLYNYAVVIDDIDMEITDVIRGEDHISNTPKQILIYKALGKELPRFAHLPLILGSDKSKMSKRHGATSINDYKKDYLPEAMINFMASLGYTYSKDLISADEMVKEFELEKVHKSGAVFDVKKLNWINSQYIRKLSPDEFKKLADVPNLPDNAVPMVTERLEKLTNSQNFDFLWKKPKETADSYNKEMLIWKKSTAETALKALQLLEKLDWNNLDSEKLKTELDGLAEKEFANDRGAVYWPLRVALSGKEKSPDPLELFKVKGDQDTLSAIKNAIKKLE